MATSYGWTGKILRVDLTAGKITETPTSDYAPQLIGGRGIAAMIYWEEVSPECEALSPENALIMMTGVADGTLLPSGSRLCVVTKTPVLEKECYMPSSPSGHVSAELKFAGYDGIVVTGKSPRPVYLWINDGKAELRSAERLWGMRLSELMLEIYNLHGPQTRVAAIGPAGENLCRQAPIIVDREHATGISGAGAVMGSKNLKAIAVRGTGAVNVAKPQEVIDLWYYSRRLLARTPAEVAAGEGWPHTTRSLSYYMWHSPHIPYCEGHPEKPGPELYYQNYGLDNPLSLMREAVDAGTVKIKWDGCYSCAVHCGMTYQSTDADIPSGAGQCNDMESWPRHDWKGYKKVVGVPDIWFNRWCDDLGLSITNTIGYHGCWWELLVEAGIITKENTGLPTVTDTWTLPFIKGVLEMIAYRRGEIGNGIAEGEIRFLKSIGEKYPDVWNAEPSADEAPILYAQGEGHKSLKEMYDMIIVPHSGRENGYFLDKIGGPAGENYDGNMTALMQAAAVRREVNGASGGGGKSFQRANAFPAGLTSAEANAIQKKGNLKYFGAENATFVSGEPQTWENKVPTAIWLQNYNVMMDSISLCRWAGAYSFYSNYTPPDYLGDPAIGAKYYSAVTGIDTTLEQLLEAFGAVWNIERAIHVREGRRREHDYWNDAIYKGESWAWTSKEEFEGKVMDEYYTLRGWDLETGIPRRSTLEEQGLKKIADELESKYGVTVPE
jgi:aldehyde:ferredoxin oxidoreductase